MKITVYNSKGGAGKTPISANIAFDKKYALGTNEAFESLGDVFPEKRVMSVEPDEEFPTLPPEIDIVFDLAGSIAKYAYSITSAVKQSDLVIVPISNEPRSRKSGIGTILQLEAFTPNILVVATKLKAQRGEKITNWFKCVDFLQIKADLRANLKTPYTVLPLKYSTAFDMIFERGMSIKQIAKSDPLLAHAYRDVIPQFNAIYKHIKHV